MIEALLTIFRLRLLRSSLSLYNPALWALYVLSLTQMPNSFIMESRELSKITSFNIAVDWSTEKTGVIFKASLGGRQPSPC